jgi:hypothetical protein
MVPAALTGLDLARLLNSAVHMAQLCAQTPAQENPAAQLGVIMGELANAQRDKLTFITSPAICSFGDWVEQLIAESTGKQNAAGQGVGILPVVGGAVVDPSLYAGDRLFVYLRLAGDHTHDLSLIALEDAGQPVVDVEVADLYDLGGQFYLWELAIAIAGARMGIQPFDQPNVEAAKVQARKVADDYREQGRLPEPKPTLQSEQVSVYGAAHDAPVENLGDAWRVFLDGLQPGDYLAVQAYLPAGEDLDASLLALRGKLLRRTRLAVTTGYGPRFLHSTGQLHKGDAGRGRFIQITHDHPLDAAIPEQAGQFASAMSFGVLELAQALGDRQALESAGRKVLRFHITGDVLVGLERIIAALP